MSCWFLLFDINWKRGTERNKISDKWKWSVSASRNKMNNPPFKLLRLRGEVRAYPCNALTGFGKPY
jgi:hypothetical protein